MNFCYMSIYTTGKPKKGDSGMVTSNWRASSVRSQVKCPVKTCYPYLKVGIWLDHDQGPSPMTWGRSLQPMLRPATMIWRWWAFIAACLSPLFGCPILSCSSFRNRSKSRTLYPFRYLNWTLECASPCAASTTGNVVAAHANPLVGLASKLLPNLVAPWPYAPPTRCHSSAPTRRWPPSFLTRGKFDAWLKC